MHYKDKLMSWEVCIVKKLLAAARNQYRTFETIKIEEYEKAKATLPKDEFETQYSIGSESDHSFVDYRKSYLEYSDDEIKLIALSRIDAKLEKAENHLRIIKGCVIFFVVLASLGICAYLISLLVALS